MPKFIVSWTERVKNSLEIEADSADAAMTIAKSGDVDDDVFTESVDRDDDSFRVAELDENEGPSEPEPDFRGPDRSEWKHEAAAAQRLK